MNFQSDPEVGNYCCSILLLEVLRFLFLGGDTQEVFDIMWGNRSGDIFSLVDFNAITMFSCYSAGNLTFLIKIRSSWLM